MTNEPAGHLVNFIAYREARQVQRHDEPAPAASVPASPFAPRAATGTSMSPRQFGHRRRMLAHLGGRAASGLLRKKV